jgi:hypothetical protein
MKIQLFFFIFFVGVLVIGCQSKAQTTQPPAEEEQDQKKELSREELVKRGEYMVTVMGCHDCHSPKKMTDAGPVPDPERLLSGHRADQPLPEIDQTASGSGWILFNGDLTAAVGPWGVSFAANLSSDATGIGNWTEEQFKTAVRKGKFKGLENGRNLLPPMPWPNLTVLSDEDLKAIFYYLKSLPPVRNVVPQPIPPSEIQ